MRAAVLIVFALSAVFLPLAGSQFASVAPAPPARSFSWSAFLIYTVVILAVVAPFVWRIATVRPELSANTKPRRFPGWGWVGLALLAIAWVFAWTRLEWFAPLQLYTFTPLWLGYIGVINALTYRRTGHCLLLNRPGCFLALFPASAAFWWYFEYVNRYVGNWLYAGVESVGPIEYFVHATISFSTVLPAVVSTRDWLATFPHVHVGLMHGWPLRLLDNRAVHALLLLLGALGFLAVGLWPQYSYSMVWVAPLLMLVALDAAFGRPNLIAGVAHGDWRGVGLPALAALLCGFFWELWNWQSLAHWEYRIPLVHRFLVFEMPLLGYAGYLPFGVVCIAISDLICRDRRDDSAANS